jgi:hypothetical protein
MLPFSLPKIFWQHWIRSGQWPVDSGQGGMLRTEEAGARGPDRVKTRRYPLARYASAHLLLPGAR